ncbi:hypothetical protein VUR80DRAFT_9135 [Thermomyces stellatus]
MSPFPVSTHLRVPPASASPHRATSIASTELFKPVSPSYLYFPPAHHEPSRGNPGKAPSPSRIFPGTKPIRPGSRGKGCVPEEDDPKNGQVEHRAGFRPRQTPQTRPKRREPKIFLKKRMWGRGCSSGQSAAKLPDGRGRTQASPFRLILAPLGPTVSGPAERLRGFVSPRYERRVPGGQGGGDCRRVGLGQLFLNRLTPSHVSLEPWRRGGDLGLSCLYIWIHRVVSLYER